MPSLDVGKIDEHPLAVVNGINMMENKEMIDLDVSRLHSTQINGPNEEAALQQILVSWVKSSGVEYRQGMHEICLVLYLESGKDTDVGYTWYANVMRWLYPLFYRDSGVNEWIENDFCPLIQSQSPRKLHEILTVRYRISHAVWCIRWCRLLFIRELDGPGQYLPVWDELYNVENKGKFMASVIVVMLMCIIPELTEAQNESECLFLLLNYPKLKVPIENVIKWAKMMYDNEQPESADTFAAIGKMPLEETVLRESNAGWYSKYKDYDVNRIRMEMRLKRHAKWRLSK
ncbi:unnamed protein product [Kluyveromyces dobzhanskii CBS 2104]|uniref:WGS project CCBQ000000000 data, contig 00014 n=1 Tax=Kluyveromyces dobzhanskii CBS 2104 TaxID=1427455 RepID=A0A0A8L9D6_9SACH|nr:unnamed protein product [Kluyveromyces dobzhanskii CBS 2104]